MKKHDFTSWRKARKEEQDLPPEKLLEILRSIYTEESAIRMFNQLMGDKDEN